MRRIALIRLLSGSVFLAAALLTAGDAGAYPNAGPAETAAVIRDSTWDPGRRDSWSAFTVSVSSEHGFSGEVRLVPTPLRQADGAQMPEPDRPAPTLRAPLVLEAGVERSMAVMAPVGETAYRGELWDVSGARVSVGQARRAEMRASINLGVLTDLPNGGALLQAASQQQPNVRRRFWSTGDFPASVLSLTGLDGLIVGNLDSNALSVEQRQALQDFVGLGGSLLLTGGVEGQRTAAALPDVLVPLRPDGTAVASLGPLAELDKQTTNRVTIIITGALDSGRVAVGAVGGPPLVVEARYGWGHIIQLTYDPFAVAAEPQAAAAPQSTGVIFRPVAWSVGLLQNGRATALSAAAAPPLPGRHPASPPAPAWSVLEGEAGPGGARGGPVGLLLVAYPFVAGGLLLVLGRSRSRGALRWVAVPALAALVTVAVLPVGWGLRGALNVDELSIERLGPPGGAGELESFHRMVASGRADLVLRLANPSLASITADPRPSRALPAVLAERNPQRGPGDDQIEVGDAPSVYLRQLAGWDARRLHTLTPTRAAGGIEAHLRLQAGHLVGTVTNRGERPVRRLRAQRGDAGQAQLAAELGPGATARVDVPVAPVAPALHPEPSSAWSPPRPLSRRSGTSGCTPSIVPWSPPPS
ncbi:MAG: hypothetical protein WKF86_00645 [Acidimicrobiales bacterium]